MSTLVQHDYYWAVLDTYPRTNQELFLRYTVCLCGPRGKEGLGTWKVVKEFRTKGPATRLANKLNKQEEVPQ